MPGLESIGFKAVAQLLSSELESELHDPFSKPKYENIHYLRSERLKNGSKVKRFSDVHNKCSVLIKDKINLTLNNLGTIDSKNQERFDVIQLCIPFAILCKEESVDLLLRMAVLPPVYARQTPRPPWDMIQALEYLQLTGVILPAIEMETVFKPLLSDYLNKEWLDDSDEQLVIKFIQLLIFSDNFPIALKWIDNLFDRLSKSYHLREIISFLGYIKSDEAFRCLIDWFERPIIKTRFFREWLISILFNPTKEVFEYLISAVDGTNSSLAGKIMSQYHLKEDFAEKLAHEANDNISLYEKLLQASPIEKSCKELQSLVLGYLEGDDVISVQLALIDDQSTNPIPYALSKSIENLYWDKQYLDNIDGAYETVPRVSNDIRLKLFDMAINDPKRRHSALKLLAEWQVERIERGYHPMELRHPYIKSNYSWPPIELMSIDE